MSCLTDIIIEIVKMQGDLYEELFRANLYNALILLTQPEVDSNIRHLALGCLAEILFHLPTTGNLYAESLYSVCLSIL